MKRALPAAALALGLALGGCGYLPTIKMKLPSKAARIDSKLDKAVEKIHELREKRFLACMKKYQKESLSQLQNAADACQLEMLPIIL